VDHQPDQVSAIVLRTGDPGLLAAAVAATRLAMATWPSGEVVKGCDALLIDGDGSDMFLDMLRWYANPPGVGEPSRHMVRQTLETAAARHAVPNPPGLQPVQPTPAQAQHLIRAIIRVDDRALHGEDDDLSGVEEQATPRSQQQQQEDTGSAASALHRRGLPLTRLDEQNAESEVDWGTDDHPMEPATAVCFGIDLGGVLWPYIYGSKNITYTFALESGPLGAAQQWVHTLVSRIGPKNVHIISKVGFRAEEIWSNVLRDSGFLQNTGMLAENVHWVRDRTGINGKAPIAMRLGLTHFVDDRYDVLHDIQRHFKEHNLMPPQLYLVPTTTFERDGPVMRFVDIQNAKGKVRQHRPHNSIQYFEGLHMVPFPPMPLT
jgi:hypothetical protein